jgi:hypothetical protein
LSLTLRVKLVGLLGMFGNKILRKFVPEEEEALGGWGKLCNFFVFTKYFYGYQIKDYDMGGICRANKGSTYTILTKTWKENRLG